MTKDQLEDLASMREDLMHDADINGEKPWMIELLEAMADLLDKCYSNGPAYNAQLNLVRKALRGQPTEEKEWTKIYPSKTG